MYNGNIKWKEWTLWSFFTCLLICEWSWVMRVGGCSRQWSHIYVAEERGDKCFLLRNAAACCCCEDEATRKCNELWMLCLPQHTQVAWGMRWKRRRRSWKYRRQHWIQHMKKQEKTTEQEKTNTYIWSVYTYNQFMLFFDVIFSLILIISSCVHVLVDFVSRLSSLSCCSTCRVMIMKIETGNKQQ